MVRARRVKRDSVTNIYRGCKAAGTCPPDVLNKVEQTTIADQILKYGSAGVFFGGLGISTGRGTGGSTGYVPLGEGPSVRVGGTPSIIRPSVIPETIGPADIIPIDTVNPIDPTASSVVPLTESTGPDLLPGEIETIAEIHPVPEVRPVDTSVTTNTRGSSAVLEVAPEPVPPTRTRISRTQYHNPSFQIISESTPSTGESSLADHIIVTSGSGGQQIGGPRIEIELEEIPSRYSFDIEEPTPPRRSSTPVSAARRALGAIRRGIYNRRLTQQINVTDPLFIQQPSRLVRFQFDNPAFEEEVTQIFDRDINEIEEPPNRDFLDIARLSRPLFSETPQGYVRVSRLGNRATIRTRSGATIGSQVHFYQDLSTIDNVESMELSLLGEHSGDASIVQGPVESTFVEANLDEIPELSEEPDFNSEDLLLDEHTDHFSDSQLVFGTGRRTVSYTIPRFETPRSDTIFLENVQGYTVAYPERRDRPEIIYPMPDLPAVVIHIYDDSGDFYLHPSLKKRKRKRAYL